MHASESVKLNLNFDFDTSNCTMLGSFILLVISIYFIAVGRD